MLREVIRLIVDDLYIMPQRFQIGLQGIRLQGCPDVINIVTGDRTNFHDLPLLLILRHIRPSFALIRVLFGSQLIEYQWME